MTGRHDTAAQQVVAAIHTDDPLAFLDLAERHRHELRLHCYRMLGSFTDSDLLLQETLLRAWGDRASFDAHTTFRGWLYRVATHVCLDALSELTAAPETTAEPHAPLSLADIPWLQPYPDTLLDLATGHVGQWGTVVPRESTELVFLAAGQRLSPWQRAVLILTDVLDWPIDSVAEALGLSVAATSTVLQRARTTMEHLLPDRRAGPRTATGPTTAERTLLRRFAQATRSADTTALTHLLREDARQAMPPAALVFEGRAAIMDLWGAVLAGSETADDWIAVPVSANRQPALANYVRRSPGERHVAVNIDVLQVEGSVITEIVTFGPELFPAFGLSGTA